MSEAYERERQNNTRLDDLAGKITALRGVTVDIYNEARDHATIDNSAEAFSDFGTGLKNSIGRVKLMAQSGNRVQILKLAGCIVAVVVVLWMLWGWVAR